LLLKPDSSAQNCAGVSILEAGPESEPIGHGVHIANGGIDAASNRLTGQKVKPFLPNVSAGCSNDDFGAVQGSSTSSSDNREKQAEI